MQVSTPKHKKRFLFTIDDEIVGDFKADVIVEDSVILELKSVRQIAVAHEVQLVNYLTATKKDIGLIINFGEKKVEIKRKVRKLPDRLII